jgi:ligand-binding SRPBCC domain-containing protein
MKLYQLKRSQCLPLAVDDAWEFFSRPSNLPRITPAWLNLTVTSSPPDAMHPGMIITYRIYPLFRIPMTWITEITHVRQPYFFVDEQRFGPYRFWHHQHIFTPAAEGIEMHDIVHYALKFGLLGRLIHGCWLRRRLEHIFDYRKKQLHEHLRKTNTGASISPLNGCDPRSCR